MAKKAAKKAGAQPKKRAAPRMRTRGDLTAEQKLLNLIVDPCGAELTTGFASTTTGLVQRFVKTVVPVATSENAFAFIFFPTNQSTNGITLKLGTGTGPSTFSNAVGPGEAFLNANADSSATLAACMELLYTGTVVNRKGYVGVCQVPEHVAEDIVTNTIDLPSLQTYCQTVAPVGAGKIEVKWQPGLPSFTGNMSTSETAGSGPNKSNAIMVVALNVSPNDFVARFTSVVEYTPKFSLGVPAPRVSKHIPIGVGERILSALDRAQAWWHNLGSAAGAAYRMGITAKSVGQAASYVTSASRSYKMIEPALTMLALTG